MSIFASWDGIRREFIRDGVTGLHSDWGDFKEWSIPLKVSANVCVDGMWNGATLRVRLAHSYDLQEWSSIDGGEFLPISRCGEQTIEFMQPSRFNRIEYWLENADEFTYIRIYVEIDPEENPIGWPPASEDGLMDSRHIIELYATGEGIPTALTMLREE
jgi:hypothetical protein